MKGLYGGREDWKGLQMLVPFALPMAVATSATLKLRVWQQGSEDPAPYQSSNLTPVQPFARW